MNYSVKGLNKLSKEFNNFQIDAGFTDSNITQRLMLVITEVTEAFEAFRKDKRCRVEDYENGYRHQEKRINKMEGFELHVKDSMPDEIADAIIRLIAFCGENNIDIEKHIELKMEYNEMRGFKYGGMKF